jgi:hypothetical protein
MACFCQDCSETLFGRDFGELAGQTTPDETRQGIYSYALCESCGCIEVDHTGRRIVRENSAPPPAPATPDTRAKAYKDGGVSICWHCRNQLVRVRSGFLFAQVRDPIGNVNRVHLDCLRFVVGDGYTEVKAGKEKQ